MKKLALGAMLLSASVGAYAVDDSGWATSVQYSTFSQDLDGDDVSVGALVGSLGYQIEMSENFFVVPEVRFGTGIKDGSLDYGLGEADVTLDQFFAFSPRIQFQTDSGLYFFGQPSYAKASYSINETAGDFEFSSEEEEDWQFGFGAGAGFYFSDALSAELQYEQFDEIEGISVGMRISY